jgi:NADH:ubiquinone oxidoreductase subunit 6 (subunit J)
MKRKTKRNILALVIVVAIGAISNFLVRTTPVSKYSVFDTVGLFTYFGVLIGFALTIYTFGLSMVSDISEKIDSSGKMNNEKKFKIHKSLIDGFAEIKEDIWLIFYSIIM